jgi:hypothetical protein
MAGNHARYAAIFMQAAGRTSMTVIETKASNRCFDGDQISFRTTAMRAVAR